MTTPTTPIVASVGETTPIPERPTLYVVVYPDRCGTSWKSTRVVTDASEVEPATLGSVLVTIPGTRDASPTEPRGEREDWLDSTAEHIVLYLTHNVRHNRVNDEKAVIDWVKSCIRRNQQPAPTPPRDRCEVCGGTGKELADAEGAAVYVACRECQGTGKEMIPCESGSGSSVSSEGTMSGSSSSATSNAGSPASRIRHEPSRTPQNEPASTATAASDPATVAGEGPYRVDKQFDGWFQIVHRDGTHVVSGGDTIFSEADDADDACQLANHAHRAALAGCEAEVVRLRKALREIADGRIMQTSAGPVAIATNALKGAAR
jgi:hypothetical protein